MIILKTKEFLSPDSLIEFVIKNNITRENILAITTAYTSGTSAQHFIYFYGDSNVKELTHGVFGWS